MSVQETRMMSRALAQRWPVKSEYREAIIKKLMRVMADPNSSTREVIAAAKGLLAAEAQNQADEHKLVDVSISATNDRLDAIAADLGIDIGVIEDATRKAKGSTDRIEGEASSDGAAS
jgi:hypothetical protein